MNAIHIFAKLYFVSISVQSCSTMSAAAVVLHASLVLLWLVAIARMDVMASSNKASEAA